MLAAAQACAAGLAPARPKALVGHLVPANACATAQPLASPVGRHAWHLRLSFIGNIFPFLRSQRAAGDAMRATCCQARALLLAQHVWLFGRPA